MKKRRLVRFEPHGRGGPPIREIPLRLVMPNLITVLAICAGLTGIRLAFEHRFEVAVGMVLIAAFLDGIDGRVARFFKASSRFGAQLDSLADIVNFGVAPALVLYAFLLDRAGPPGWIAALLFVIACGLRLARFNVLDEDPDRPAWQAEYFVGVPAPVGAMIVLLPAYLGFMGVETERPLVYSSCVFTVIVAMLMISRLPVHSGKTIGKRISADKVVPVLFGIVAYALFLFIYPWETLIVTCVGYLAFLPMSAAAYSRRAKLEAAAAESAVAEPPQA